MTPAHFPSPGQTEPAATPRSHLGDIKQAINPATLPVSERLDGELKRAGPALRGQRVGSWVRSTSLQLLSE